MAAAHATNLACAAALWLSPSLSLYIFLSLKCLSGAKQHSQRGRNSRGSRTSERAISRRSTREFHRRDSPPMKEVGGSGETKASNARKLKSVDAGGTFKGGACRARTGTETCERRNKRIHWHRSRCFPPDFLYFARRTGWKREFQPASLYPPPSAAWSLKWNFL